MTFCADQEVEDFEEAEEICSSETDFLRRNVVLYIENYFKDKHVPKHVDLFSPKYVDMCIKMDMCRAADLAYEAIERSGILKSETGDSAIEPDIRLVIGILRRMKPLVPQEFSAGMLLMHLEILEGVKF